MNNKLFQYCPINMTLIPTQLCSVLNLILMHVFASDTLALRSKGTFRYLRLRGLSQKQYF